MRPIVLSLQPYALRRQIREQKLRLRTEISGNFSTVGKYCRQNR